MCTEKEDLLPRVLLLGVKRGTETTASSALHAAKWLKFMQANVLNIRASTL